MTTRMADDALFSPRCIVPGRLAPSGAAPFAWVRGLRLEGPAGRVAGGGVVWALGCVVFHFLFSLFVSLCICSLRRHMGACPGRRLASTPEHVVGRRRGLFVCILDRRF